MKPIYINSRNLVIVDEGTGLRTVVKGTKSEVMLIWQILTNSLLKKEGTDFLMTQFINMSPEAREGLLRLMAAARKIASNEDEVAEILSELVKESK